MASHFTFAIWYIHIAICLSFDTFTLPFVCHSLKVNCPGICHLIHSHCLCSSFDTLTLPFVCHSFKVYCQGIHYFLQRTYGFTFLLIWHSLFLFEIYGCAYFICLLILDRQDVISFAIWFAIWLNSHLPCIIHLALSFHLPFDLPFSWTHTCHSLFIWLCHYMAFTQWLWHALFLVGTYGFTFTLAIWLCQISRHLYTLTLAIDLPFVFHSFNGLSFMMAYFL